MVTTSRKESSGLELYFAAELHEGTIMRSTPVVEDRGGQIVAR